MPGLIDVSYHVNGKGTSLHESIKSYRTSYGYIRHLKSHLAIQVIQHSAKDAVIVENETTFTSFRAKAGFFHNPVKTHQYIRSQSPEVVLVQGLKNPWQIIKLRKAIGNSAK